MQESGEKQLEDIKRLLMLLLLKLDTTSDEIALALGISPGAARKIMPSSKVRKLTKGSGE
jgi:predicted ArsR family transcriptional regulator